MVKLAKLDLQKGTKVDELVFSCCKWFPTKEGLESLIQIGKKRDRENEKKVVESIFNFRNHNGSTCLMSIFSMANWYRNRTDKYPTGRMLRSIEQSCIYLINLAKSAELDLTDIINRTAKDGDTLFFNASMFSLKVTKILLENSAKVNSVRDNFLTPFFRVSLKTYLRK